MRSRIPRLAGIATAAALVLATLAAAPAATAAAPEGTIKLTIVDDLGKPVAGVATLYPADSNRPAITLGSGSGSPRPASFFDEDIEVGTYGVAVMGGWAGLTCLGLSDCSIMQLMGSGPDATLTPAAVTVTEAGTTAVTVTVATPKLTGTPALGSPLTVTVPKNLTDLAETMATIGSGGPGGGSPFFGAGAGTEPTVTWRRNGATFGETGSTYVPNRADAAATLTASVSYPQVVSFFFSYQGMGTAIPGTFTTAPVSFGKLQSQLTISSPKGYRQGSRPVVYVNAKVGQASADGVVALRVGKRRAQQAVLRSGLVAFKLPKLKPGKYTLTATFAETGQYVGATASSTTVVKARKHGKGKKHKK